MGTYACISCRDKLCEYLSCNEVDIDALKTKVRDVRKKCNAAVKKSSEKKREADKDYQIYAYPYGSEYPSDSANDVKMTDGSQTDCDSKIKTNTENLYRIIEPFVDFTFIGGTSSNGIYKECFKRSATKETRENNSQYKVKAFIIKSIDYSLKYLVKNPCPAKDGKKFTDEVKANVKAVLEQLSESTSFNHTVQHLNKEFEKEDLKIKEYTGLLQFQKEFIDGVFELRLASGGDIILTPLSSLLDEIQLDDQGANRDQDSIRLGLDKLNSVIEHLYFNGMQMCANISKNENVLRISRRLHTYKAIDFSTVDRDEYSKLLGIPDSQFQYIKNKNYVGNLNLTSLEKSLCERENLEKLLLNIRNNRDTIVCGKAGSGKSMLAILAFVEQYRRFVTPGQTDARVPINLYPERLYNQCRDNEFKERLIINECERSEEVSHEILSKTSVLFIDNIDEFLSDNTTLTFSIVNCLVDIPMVIFCRSKIRDTIVR